MFNFLNLTSHYIVYKTRPGTEITEYYYFVTGCAVLLSWQRITKQTELIDLILGLWFWFYTTNDKEINNNFYLIEKSTVKFLSLKKENEFPY